MHICMPIYIKVLYNVYGKLLIVRVPIFAQDFFAFNYKFYTFFTSLFSFYNIFLIYQLFYCSKFITMLLTLFFFFVISWIFSHSPAVRRWVMPNHQCAFIIACARFGVVCSYCRLPAMTYFCFEFFLIFIFIFFFSFSFWIFF